MCALSNRFASCTADALNIGQRVLAGRRHVLDGLEACFAERAGTVVTDLLDSCERRLVAVLVMNVGALDCIIFLALLRLARNHR